MVKVTRSYPAPESLAIEKAKSSGRYDKPDVIERLKQDFNDKCYIYEMKWLQDPVVEHLLPHKNGEYVDRKFDWDNLFWSCGHCNGVKNRKEYDVGIIDCCKRDPEKLLMFDLVEDDVLVCPLDECDKEAMLTAKLIYEVFNIQNTGMRIQKSRYRLQKLQAEMNSFYKLLEKYKKFSGNKRYKAMIEASLRRESAFAAFKRAYIRKRQKEFPELLEILL